jgi:hypothetical protein
MSDATDALTGWIRREASTIVRCWDQMLPESAPAQTIRIGHSRAAGIVSDHSKPIIDSSGREVWPSDWSADIPGDEVRTSDQDIDRTTKLVSLRRHVVESLNGWCRLVAAEKPVKRALPDGADAKDMARFLDRHADWIAESAEWATDCASELEDFAAQVSLTVDPPRKERHRLGPCPFVHSEGDRLVSCGGRVSLPIGGDEDEATCDRCGQAAPLRWWEEVLGLTRWEAATIPELARIIGARLHMEVTERTVRNWANQERIRPWPRIGPQPMHRVFDVREVLDEVARWGGSCVMCGSLWEGQGDTCTRCYVARMHREPVLSDPRPAYIVGSVARAVEVETVRHEDERVLCQWSDLPARWCGCRRHARQES